MTALAKKSAIGKENQGAGAFLEAARDNFKNGSRMQLDSANDETHSQKFMFDSASVGSFMAEMQSRSSPLPMPPEMGVIYDELGAEKFPVILRALLDGASEYERNHGCLVPDDVVLCAIKKAFSTTNQAQRQYSLQSLGFDSASSASSDPLSLQTNRAVVSILSTMMSAVPFAMYLPFDLGSNEAKLAIISHQAGSATGRYAANENIDGANSGSAYLTSMRIHKATRGIVAGSAVPYTGKITKVMTDAETCDQNAGDLKLLKGRAMVYINGQVAANETSPGVISGSITIGALTYTSAGTINNDTGAFTVTITSSGAVLGSTNTVHVKSFIDYERDSSIIPSINTQADTYKLFAMPWQAYVQSTIGAQTQMSNELGIDPIAQSMVALSNQFENERHYQALLHVRLLATQNSDTFDFDWPTRSAQMNASQIFNDMLPIVARLSQQMAIDTMMYGIKYWYVGQNMASVIQGLPRSIFEPSGLSNRPGIFRLGRLFGQYEVYYTPREATESGSDSNILLIGDAYEASRSPIVFGDAVARITQPLGKSTDLKGGYGCYERNFLEVNPHKASSLGCASLAVSNFVN